MLVRVRDFGTTHPSLFDRSPTAQQTFAAVASVVDELTATDGRKLAASTGARGDRKTAARRALKDLLIRVSQLAKNLQSEGRPVPPFVLPRSKSDVSLISAGHQFAADVAAFEAEFTGHAMGPAHITDATKAFESAVSDKGMNRSDHIAAGARIRDLIAAGSRGARRLDLIVDNTLANDNPVKAAWTQLRRLKDARVLRGNSQPEKPGADQPAAPPGPVEPAGAAPPAPPA
jgi:hypothetical protein